MPPSLIPIHLGVLRDLRCRHCTKFVSCGPVYVVPDGSVLCGRCRALAIPNFRNIALEAVANLFYYPCCYWSKHCKNSLYWNESIEHERSCVHQNSCKLFCSKPGAYFKAERKIPDRPERITLQKIPEQILESLKCAICECYLSCDPIYIGADGKNMCHRCITNNGIPEGCIRNISYERLANITIFPCIFRHRGCTTWMRFGRELWHHEADCPYASSKKFTKQISKNGKERGVIQTHSGHVWGTITPNSVPFAPPKNKNDGKIVIELENEMKKKQREDENKSVDSQSINSITTDSSTGRSGKAEDSFLRAPESPVRNSNRTQEALRSPNLLQIQQDEQRRTSNKNSATGRSGKAEDSFLRAPESPVRNSNRIQEAPRSPNLLQIQQDEQRRNSNNSPQGHYQDNVQKYGNRAPDIDYLSFHFPPLTYYQHSNPGAATVRRHESHKKVINELKRTYQMRVPKKEESPYQESKNLEDIVQVHEEMLKN